MTWSAQVWHVLRKDLVTKWPGILFFAGMLLVSMTDVVSAVETPWAAFSSIALPGAFAGIIIGGIAPDLPARSDVFWATQPLRPDAVATAKLLYLLLIVLIGITSTVVALRFFHVETATLITAVGARLWLVLCFTIPVAHLATIFTDRPDPNGGKARLVMLTLVLLVVVVVMTGRAEPVMQVIRAIPTALYVLAFLGGVALFVRTYQLRERSALVSGATIVCSSLMLASMLASTTPDRYAPGAAAAPVTVDSASAAFTAVHDSNTGSMRITLDHADVEAGMVYRLAAGTLTMVMRDGSRTAMQVENRWMPVRMRGPRPALRIALAGEVSTAREPRERTVFDEIRFVREFDRLRQDSVARLILDWTLETHQLHEVSRFPLLDTLPRRDKGAEVQCISGEAKVDGSGPEIQVNVRWLPLVLPTSWWRRTEDMGRIVFALRDGSSATLIPLEVRSFHGGKGTADQFGRRVSSAGYTLRVDSTVGATSSTDSARIDHAPVLPSGRRLDTASVARSQLIVSLPRLRSARRFHAEFEMPQAD